MKHHPFRPDPDEIKPSGTFVVDITPMEVKVISQEEALSHLVVGYHFIYKNMYWEISEVQADRFKYVRMSIKARNKDKVDRWITFEYYMSRNHLFKSCL